MMSRYLDAEVWAAVPFHFWSAVFFVFGSIVGSFLNVCIHRLPRGENLIHPRSHCPYCGYSIPWYLNIPLVTWLYLRGRCANCRAPIAARYFLVELLTAGLFLACWLQFGGQSVPLVLAYAVLLSGLIVASFIDVEHFIIPDAITLGGMGAGFGITFLVPSLHGELAPAPALIKSFTGIVIGSGMLYLILRLGKLLFGRQRVDLAPDTRVVFTDTALVLPNREIPYADLFYRKSDTLTLEAKTVELADRGYERVKVELSPQQLRVGDEVWDPETVVYMEVRTDRLVLPREAMGLGDVKFMGAIGAFLGWEAAVFALMVSSMIGAVVGLSLIACKRREWSSRLPYGPYIAIGAAIWVFGGRQIVAALFPH
ncbi:MAG: prepilin peptidase [Verrucomicrobia bacterium]|nr:prepilin peptidase [Verrucomicrobiota bacterium]